jgi:hypothetical protein
MVLKVALALVIASDQIERFVNGMREVVHDAHDSTDFWRRWAS